MTSGAPWSVKGIDPKAREIAKVLARRSGMTLGEWLNQVILEDNQTSEDLAPTDYSSDPYGSPRRQPAFQPSEGYRRYEAPSHIGDEAVRFGDALDRLSARIEAAEMRSAQAISGIDQSVSSLVDRLSVAEREQTVVAARFEGAVDDLRTETSRVGERLRRAEQEDVGSRTAEAIKSVEGALAKVASHLYEGDERTRVTLAGLRRDVDGLNGRVEEGLAAANPADLIEAVVARLSERLEHAELRTTTALRSLETSFGSLDQRLAATEQRLEGGATEGALQQLASDLTERVEAARAEMAEKLNTAADGRVERVEQALEEMNGHVQAAERRSAQAIEKMGHEVLRMADVLGRKVSDVETRSTQAIEQVSGDVRRLADTMEARMERADMIGAAALERLGGEIARITERLAERIGDSERRSAQAIDDVGEQLTRATGRMQDHQDRVTGELSDRIRQSEERTARLLEDARVRIDERLAETNRRLETKVATPEPVMAAPAYVPAPGYAAQAFGPAYAGQAFVAPSYSPPVYGEPIYIEPDVAPFGHDSFAASRPPAGQTAPLAPPLANEPAYVADAEFEADETRSTAPLIADELDEPDFHEPGLVQATSAEEPAEPMDPALDPFLSPAEVIAATVRMMAEFGIEPDSLSQGHAAQAVLEEAPLPQAEPHEIRVPAVEAESAWAPPSAAVEPKAAPPLPGATFASQPFAVHSAPTESWSPTETYVTTPAHLAGTASEAVEAHVTFDEGDDDLDAPEPTADGFAPLASAPYLRDISAPSAPSDLDAEAESLFAPRAAATRDLIEQARAATRAAAAARTDGRGRSRARDVFSGPAARPQPRRRQASTLTNALLISGTAASFAVVITGYLLVSEKPTGPLPQQIASFLGTKIQLPAKPAPAAVAPGPILAEAIVVKPAADTAAAGGPATAAVNVPVTPSPDAVSLYGDATRRIESRDFTGVEALKKSANLGYAPAEFYLAKLYESGEAGLKHDSAEARRWTERAAEGGDKKAMHNLALYYFEGTGGPKNTTSAAQWFRRAADLGLTDSQYNLGRLYEEGFGVAQNPAEAYKWYLIAARSGDAESHSSAQRIKGQLSVESQAAAERAAQSFLAQGPSLMAQATVTSPVATAQRALQHLGYYQGPTDGSDSPALKLAIAAYQRDQGLPPSGALDPTLNERLSVIAQ